MGTGPGAAMPVRLRFTPGMGRAGLKPGWDRANWSDGSCRLAGCSTGATSHRSRPGSGEE